MQLSTITWQDAYALHDETMDRTHREFVTLLADLQRACLLPEGPVYLDALVGHTEEHFAQEERWMAALGFASDNCHAFQHAQVLEVMREVQRRVAAALQAEHGEMLQTLAAGLAEWFDSHARLVDAALAQTMRERGYDHETGRFLALDAAVAAAAITSCGSAACRTEAAAAA